MTCHRWEEELGLPIHRLDGTPKARVFAYTDELDRWLAEKLHVAEAPRQERRKRTKWIWITAGVVIVVAAVAALGWRLFLQAPIPAPAEVPSLAVLPFENRTGDGTWDAWKTALPDLITIDLGQSKFIEVIRTSNLAQAAGKLLEAEKFSYEDLKKLGEKAGVDFALTGSFTKSGDDIIIASQVHNAKTDEVVGSPRSTCRTEKEIFSKVDETSRDIKLALNVKPREIRRDIDKPIARITTKSSEAFKLYSQAYLEQRKRSPEDAISPLQKAVALDPKFGLAYRDLFNCCRSVSRKEEAKKYGEMAVRMADRLGERERDVFLSNFFMFERIDKKQAVQACQRLAKNYPYNQTILPGFYTNREEWDKAIPILEKLKLRRKKSPGIINNLLICYRSVGLYAKAEKLLEEYLGENSKPDPPFLVQGWILALAQKKFDVALETADRMISAYPNDALNRLRKGNTYFQQDDFANAEKEYQKLVEKDDPRDRMHGFYRLAAVSLSRGRIEEAKQRTRRGIELAQRVKDTELERHLHDLLAYLHRLTGQLPEALKEAEQACREGEKEGVHFVQKLHLRALITVEMNQFEEFEKQIEEIKGYLDPDRFPEGFPRLMRVYYHLLGHRELQKKNYPLAIRYFWQALDLLSVLASLGVDEDHAKYFYSLAEAYERSGDSWNAYPMYEKVTLPTVHREFSGDLYAKSYYWMGRYYEWYEQRAGSGFPPEAFRKSHELITGNYRKFLELWKDADPIFPEVEDAKKRLARREAE
jgi:tetratricopeptide (TPR) repeat protein